MTKKVVSDKIKIRQDLPPVGRLHELYDYCPASGKFTIKPKDRSQFDTTRAWAAANALYAGKSPRHTNHGGYLILQVDRVKVRAHRVAFAMVYGQWPAGFIDHINGDPSDNRICNLREVTSAENSRNSRVGRRNKSGVMGVKWYEDRQRYMAYITMDGKRKNLGYYKTLDEARAVRVDAERKAGFHPNHGRIAEGAMFPEVVAETELMGQTVTIKLDPLAARKRVA